MPMFVYKVQNNSGKIFAGEIKADNKEELIRLFREKQLLPIELTEKNFFTDISQIGIFKPKVKIRDISLLCRQFAIVLEAGLPISTCIDVIKDQTEHLTLREILKEIYEDIQKGSSLSTSMKKHNQFPFFLINMVEAGEVSGQLDKVFIRMSDYYEKEYKITKKVKGAMVYPIVLLSISVIVVMVMMTFVLPQFTKALTSFGTELPALTKFVIATSGVFQKYWIFIVGAIAALVSGFKFLLKTYSGRRFIASLALKVPVVKGLTQNTITAKFSRTMSTLIASGVLLIQALEMVQKIIGNEIIAEKFAEVIDEVKKGKSLTSIIGSMKIFPPLVVSMIRIGEESGGLDFSLEKAADYYDQEVDSSISSLLTMLEPMIIFFLAIIIGGIVVSVLLPMMSIYDSIK